MTSQRVTSQRVTLARCPSPDPLATATDILNACDSLGGFGQRAVEQSIRVDQINWGVVITGMRLIGQHEKEWGEKAPRAYMIESTTLSFFRQMVLARKSFLACLSR